MDFWIYAAGIAFALNAGTIAGAVLDGSAEHRPLQPRLYEWIYRYLGLGSIGLMLGAFYWYGFLLGLGAIGASFLFGAVLFALAGRVIPRLGAAVLYAGIALVLLVVHVFMYVDH